MTLARMIPENTPGLLDTMTDLIAAAIRLGYHDAKKAIGYVKDQIKADTRFKAIWNKIQQATYLKAAQRALAEKQDTATIVIDRQEYDMDAPNFGFREDPITLKDGDPLLEETYKKAGDSSVVYKGATISRSQMRKEMEDDPFLDAVPAPADRKPIAYVMGGGGASGKGTIKKHLRQNGVIQAADAVDVDPDEIKLGIPEFEQIKAAGDSRAASVVHEESSDIAQAVIARAMKGRYDIIIDKTLGDAAKGVKYLQSLKDAGYDVRLFGVSTNVETSVARAKLRAQRFGRYVPIDLLIKAHKGFVSAFESYVAIVDKFDLYENTDEINHSAKKVDGRLEIKDQSAEL